MTEDTSHSTCAFQVNNHVQVKSNVVGHILLTTVIASLEH